MSTSTLKRSPVKLSTPYSLELIATEALSTELTVKKSRAHIFTIHTKKNSYTPSYPLFEVKSGVSKAGYATSDLLKLNERVKAAMEEVLQVSNAYYIDI